MSVLAGGGGGRTLPMAPGMAGFGVLSAESSAYEDARPFTLFTELLSAPPRF